ncbi:MAG: hypothetical protein ACFFDN_27315 [Candidatus Hodarchaeota archaeon]
MQLFNISDKGELIKIDRLKFEEPNVYLVDDEEKNTIFIWVGLQVPQSKKDITADIARRIDKDRGGSAKILIMKQKREYGSFLAMMHDLEKGLIPGRTVKRRPEFVFEVPPESIKSIGLDGTPEAREIKIEERIAQWLQQIKDHRVFKSQKEPSETIDAVKFIKFEQPTLKVEVKAKDQLKVMLEESKERKKVAVIKETIGELEEPEEPDFKTQIREAAYFLSLDGYTYDQLCWILAEKIQKINLDIPSIEDIRRKAEEVFNSSCTYDELCWLNAEMDLLTKKSFLEKEKKIFDY